MYWVIWSVFQNLCTFPGFPGISGVPVLLQMVLDGFGVVWTYLGATRYNWRSLDVLGHVWTCSRSFGLRQVLAGHPCRCQVREAHGRSRIDVARWLGSS